MQPICTFTIVPSLPTKLERLRELAYNLWWSWNLEAIDLFRRLDRELWEVSGHNPVLMLGTIKQERLEEAAEDDGFLTHLERVYQQFDRYMKSQNTWYQKAHGASREPYVAYFSAEFGSLTACPRMPGAWESWLAITLNPPATWACPWWGWDSSIRRGTSVST